jgi:hypothetical protein
VATWSGNTWPKAWNALSTDEQALLIAAHRTDAKLQAASIQHKRKEAERNNKPRPKLRR